MELILTHCRITFLNNLCFTNLKFLKDERESKIVPALIYIIGRNEVTATVKVMAAANSKEGFAIYVEELYDTSTTTNSNPESFPFPDFPSVDLTEVQYIYRPLIVLLYKLYCNNVFLFSWQSFDNSELSKTPGSANSVNKKIKVVTFTTNKQK